MSQSWRVQIHCLQRLSGTDYRFGDITKSLVHKVKKHMDGDGGSSGSEAVPSDVAVELRVGNVCKRTKVVRSEGTEEVQLGDSLLLPAPDGRSERLLVQVWRVNLGIQPDALVGDAVVERAPASNMEVDVERATQKTGTVRLSIHPVDANYVPVASGDASDEEVGGRRRKKNELRTHFMDLRNKLADTEDFQALARKPLLERSAELARLGECQVAIESVKGLATSVSEPYFVLGLDGHEYRADKFAHACEADLTYRFSFSSLQSNLYIYCYDDHKTDRNKILGRILIPLSSVFEHAGAWLPCSSCKGSTERRYNVQFMPLQGNGKLRKDDRFRPAVPGQKNTGMDRSRIFGSVCLRIRVDLELPTKSVMQCYARSILGGTSAREQSDRSVETDEEPSLLSVLKSVDLEKMVRNLKRLETLSDSPAQGIVRWLRGGCHRGFIASLLWCAFCAAALRPPYSSAWPVYIWLFLVLNGLLVKRQREQDWSNASSQPFLIWDHDNRPETLTEVTDNFKKTVRDLDRNVEIIVSCWERVLNMFSGADGVATWVCVVGSGVAAMVSSLLWFVWQQVVGSPVSVCVALMGLALIVGISRSTPPSKGDDPYKGMATFNTVFACIPDREELAHRYIATSIQTRKPRPESISSPGKEEV